MKKLNIGLMGLGRHGIRYGRHLAAGDVRNGRLEAVWRRNLSKGRSAASELGSRLIRTWPDVVTDPKVDAVVAVVPPGMHLEIARACASAGKPLLVEKPMAPAVAQGRKMAAVMKRKGLPLMVAQTLRFANAIVHLKKNIEDNLPIYTLHLAQHLEPRNLRWETEPEHGKGGILHQTGIHLADLARFLSGQEVAAVRCVARSIHNPRLYDVASAVLEMENGVTVAHLDVSKAGSGRHCWVEAVTKGGVMGADHWNSRIMKVGPRRAQMQDVKNNFTVVAALEGFCRAVLKGSAVPVPAEDALRSLEIVEGCTRSASNNGKRVRLTRLSR